MHDVVSEYLVFQDRWSLMAVVFQDRFYCIWQKTIWLLWSDDFWPCEKPFTATATLLPLPNYMYTKFSTPTPTAIFVLMFCEIIISVSWIGYYVYGITICHRDRKKIHAVQDSFFIHATWIIMLISWISLCPIPIWSVNMHRSPLPIGLMICQASEHRSTTCMYNVNANGMMYSDIQRQFNAST